MSSSSILSSPNFLRNVLRVDALSCIACGVLQVAFPAAMARLLNLPEALIAYTGEFLLVYAAVVAFVSTRNPLPRPVIWALVAGNIGWALACVLLLVSGSVSPSMLGVAYVVVQALTVAMLAELQYFGLRRAAPQPAW
ncbi:hypothetical protein SAMN05216350_109111 [Polaromonas sp. YR568]|uniref:hypothetical protein n=1 Tax=Polaromonas sp. YR568 TaxID=1855301 RepID=UPI0008DF255C|nr:hypothetical protein [Polaromonas sp. YR568]SFU94985.1 hypothetical protein SAMN05216350_109111 [Polaromonas sp. YR568]